MGRIWYGLTATRIEPVYVCLVSIEKMIYINDAIQFSFSIHEYVNRGRDVRRWCFHCSECANCARYQPHVNHPAKSYPGRPELTLDAWLWCVVPASAIVPSQKKIWHKIMNDTFTQFIKTQVTRGEEIGNRKLIWRCYVINNAFLSRRFAVTILKLLKQKVLLHQQFSWRRPGKKTR